MIERQRGRIEELRALAAQFRETAGSTALPEYAAMMTRAAEQLEEAVTDLVRGSPPLAERAGA